MNRTWSVCRQPVPSRDGERRWDQACQLLVRLAGQGSLPGLTLIAEEVPDAGSCEPRRRRSRFGPSRC